MTTISKLFSKMNKCCWYFFGYSHRNITILLYFLTFLKIK
jgi:hypothetical protein